MGDQANNEAAAAAGIAIDAAAAAEVAAEAAENAAIQAGALADPPEDVQEQAAAAGQAEAVRAANRGLQGNDVLRAIAQAAAIFLRQFNIEPEDRVAIVMAALNAAGEIEDEQAQALAQDVLFHIDHPNQPLPPIEHGPFGVDVPPVAPLVHGPFRPAIRPVSPMHFGPHPAPERYNERMFPQYNRMEEDPVFLPFITPRAKPLFKYISTPFSTGQNQHTGNRRRRPFDGEEDRDETFGDMIRNFRFHPEVHNKKIGPQYKAVETIERNGGHEWINNIDVLSRNFKADYLAMPDLIPDRPPNSDGQYSPLSFINKPRNSLTQHDLAYLVTKLVDYRDSKRVRYTYPIDTINVFSRLVADTFQLSNGNKDIITPARADLRMISRHLDPESSHVEEMYTPMHEKLIKRIQPAPKLGVIKEDHSLIDVDVETKLEKHLIENSLILKSLLQGNLDPDLRQRAITHLADNSMTNIKEAVQEIKDKNKAELISERVHTQGGSQKDSIIPCPILGQNDLDGRTRKSFIQLVGAQAFYDVTSDKNKMPLRSILQTASTVIEENSLSPSSAYALLQPVLAGKSLAFLNSQETLLVPFSSFWLTIQSLNAVRFDSFKVQSMLTELKTTIPKNLAHVLHSIYNLHSKLHPDISPPSVRQELITQAARSDVLTIIKTFYPYLFENVLARDKAAEVDYLNERDTLLKSGQEPSIATMRSNYHKFNTITSIALESCQDVTPMPGSKPLKSHINEVDIENGISSTKESLDVNPRGDKGIEDCMVKIAAMTLANQNSLKDVMKAVNNQATPQVSAINNTYRMPPPQQNYQQMLAPQMSGNGQHNQIPFQQYSQRRDFSQVQCYTCQRMGHTSVMCNMRRSMARMNQGNFGPQVDQRTQGFQAQRPQGGQRYQNNQPTSNWPRQRPNMQQQGPRPFGGMNTQGRPNMFGNQYNIQGNDRSNQFRAPRSNRGFRQSD